MPIDAMDDYFATIAGGGYAGRFTRTVHLLDRPDAAAQTQALSWHPVIAQLDGFVLDDPGTSSYHLLVRQPPCAGQILYLAHDDDSRVVFPSLTAFLRAADAALARGVALPDLHPRVSPLGDDQAALAARIEGLVAADAIAVAVCLIPSLDLANSDLLERLVAHADFYLGAAVADQLVLRPAPTLTAVAVRCATHPHPQVAKAGERALRAIGG